MAQRPIIKGIDIGRVKVLYGISNPNKLARAIKSNPKIFAKYLVREIAQSEIRDGEFLLTFGEENTFSVLEESINFVVGVLTGKIEEWIASLSYQDIEKS